MADESRAEGDRDHLHTMRELHLDALKELQDDIDNDECFLEFTSGNLAVRAEQLRAHYEKMEKAHTLYRQCAILSSNDVYTEARRKYVNTLSKVEDRIKQLDREEQSRIQPNANSTSVATDQPIYRIESSRRPQIGKFNGNAADWPGFRDVFLAEVDRRDIEPVMKLIYLRDACTDKAAKILGTWQLTAANYQLAWDSMMHAFNDDYQVVHGILDEMYRIRPSEKGSIDDLQEILNALNNSRRQLQSMMTLPVLEEQLFIHYATARMDPATQNAWEQYRNRDKAEGLTTLDELKQFLHYKTRMHTQLATNKAATQSSVERGRRSSQNDGASKVNASNFRSKPYERNKPANDFKRDSHGFGPPTACIMTGCNMIHYLGQCAEFRRLTFADRLEVIKSHQLCRCCLMTGHMSAICKKRGCSKCPDAKFKHHYFLCSKTHTDNPFKKESSIPSKTTQ